MTAGAVNDYQVELDAFRGPLDLLLYLVKRDEVDVLDIPIARVAEQFKQYLDVLTLIDVERAATRVFGDEAAAREWLGAPIPVLGGAVPIELLVTTPGHQAVMNALRRIMAGTAA